MWICLNVNAYLSVHVWELNPPKKHGRPPNQEGSANKPPASGLSVVKLLFSCGACISKLELYVLRTLNCLTGSGFNVAYSLFSPSYPLFLLHIITDACCKPTSTVVQTRTQSSGVPLQEVQTVFFGSMFILISTFVFLGPTQQLCIMIWTVCLDKCTIQLCFPGHSAKP